MLDSIPKQLHTFPCSWMAKLTILMLKRMHAGTGDEAESEAGALRVHLPHPYPCWSMRSRFLRGHPLVLLHSASYSKGINARLLGGGIGMGAKGWVCLVSFYSILKLLRDWS